MPPMECFILVHDQKEKATLNGTPKARNVFLKNVDSGQFCAESHYLVSLIIHNAPVER